MPTKSATVPFSCLLLFHGDDGRPFREHNGFSVCACTRGARQPQSVTGNVSFHAKKREARGRNICPETD